LIDQEYNTAENGLSPINIRHVTADQSALRRLTAKLGLTEKCEQPESKVCASRCPDIGAEHNPLPWKAVQQLMCPQPRRRSVDVEESSLGAHLSSAVIFCPRLKPAKPKIRRGVS
jgi:hypothetical protein